VEDDLVGGDDMTVAFIVLPTIACGAGL
jgi:hypothetical protein